MSANLASKIVTELRGHAGSNLEVLADPADPRFQEFAKRWSDIDRQTPAAIVIPASEEQIQETASVFRIGRRRNSPPTLTHEFLGP